MTLSLALVAHPASVLIIYCPVCPCLQVCVLMESMVDSLCDLLEEVRSDQLDQSRFLI